MYFLCTCYSSPSMVSHINVSQSRVSQKFCSPQTHPALETFPGHCAVAETSLRTWFSMAKSRNPGGAGGRCSLEGPDSHPEQGYC